MTVQPHHTDITLAASAVALSVGKAIEGWTPILAGLSYLIGIVAGLITIYFKIKNKQ